MEILLIDKQGHLLLQSDGKQAIHEDSITFFQNERGIIIGLKNKYDNSKKIKVEIGEDGEYYFIDRDN